MELNEAVCRLMKQAAFSDRAFLTVVPRHIEIDLLRPNPPMQLMKYCRLRPEIQTYLMGK